MKEEEIEYFTQARFYCPVLQVVPLELMAGDYCADRKAVLFPHVLLKRGKCRMSFYSSQKEFSFCVIFFFFKSLVEVNVYSLNVLLEDVRDFVKNLSFL